ncbi:hypothetical protein PALB_11810 [Pseudoalteromonas luteoviolacea B = ATCC 29581]|nr:hypothetical protein PALB_11810 [Pseudoalteromonas luteoviolacea B = ATCC 29581]
MNIPAKIIRVFKKLLLQNIGYFDGEMYSFTNKNSVIKLQAAPIGFSPRIMIIANTVGEADVQSFPIEDRAQVKKVIKNERRLDPLSHSILLDTVNGATYCQSWRFSNLPPSVWFSIPEVLLITHRDNELVVFNKQDRTHFTLASPKGYFSVRSNQFIRTVDDFLAAKGIAKSQVTLSECTNIAERLITGIQNLAFDKWTSFFVKPPSNELIKMTRKAFLPSVLIVFGYLSVTSLGLLGQQYYLQSKISGISGKVDTAIAEQQVVDNQIKTYQQLNVLVNENVKSHERFLVILSELMDDVTLTNVRIQDGRYVLRGRAFKATDLLSKLVAHKSISDAKFDFPTRRSREEDIFVISFVFKEV